MCDKYRNDTCKCSFMKVCLCCNCDECKKFREFEENRDFLMEEKERIMKEEKSKDKK